MLLANEGSRSCVASQESRHHGSGNGRICTYQPLRTSGPECEEFEVMTRSRIGVMPMYGHSSHIVQPIIALFAGLSILLAPRMLNYVIALYLVLLGILGLVPYMLR